MSLERSVYKRLEYLSYSANIINVYLNVTRNEIFDDPITSWMIKELPINDRLFNVLLTIEKHAKNRLVSYIKKFG